MSITEWIAIISLCLIYGSAIIGFWMKLNVKISELEYKIKNTDNRVTDHIRWGEAEQSKNEVKFNEIQQDLKETYKILGNKMDTMIENFGKFQVYVEKNFKK